MKKCLLLFYWACTVCMLYAQDKNTSSFLFDDFQEAVVYFKNGSQFREKRITTYWQTNFILLIVLIIR